LAEPDVAEAERLGSLRELDAPREDLGRRAGGRRLHEQKRSDVHGYPSRLCRARAGAMADGRMINPGAKLRSRSTRAAAVRAGAARLFRLDVRRADHARPLLELALDERAELPGSHVDRDRAEPVELPAQLGR